MKKETIITAIVFLGVGFLAGYIFESHQKSPEQAVTMPAATAPAQGDPASAQGLPPGHPPINMDSTIKALEEQAAQNPSDPQPLLMLANAFYDHQRFQEAVGWYQKALALDPKNVNAQTDLGTAYFNLGRAQDALAAYKKSLEIDPTHQPTIFNSIIVNLEGTHDIAAARAAWEKLHKMNPNYQGLDSLKQRLDAAK